MMKTRNRPLPFVAALALAVGLAGCEWTEPTAANTGGQPPSCYKPCYAVFNVDELASAVTLTEAQKTVVSEALEDWRQSAGEPGARRQGMAMAFIADVAPELSTDQLAAVTTFMAQHRAQQARAHRGQRGRGAGRGGGFEGRVAERLGLSDEQREQLRAAAAETRTACRALRDRHAAGEISEEEMTQGIEAMRAQMRGQAEKILTPEQLEKWERLRNERRGRGVERRLQRLGEGQEARVEQLTRVLGLTDEQRAAVSEILASTVSKRRAVLEGVREGTIDRKDAFDRQRAIRDEAHDAIKGVLTEEQIERFDAVQPFGPRGSRGVREPRRRGWI